MIMGLFVLICEEFVGIIYTCSKISLLNLELVCANYKATGLSMNSNGSFQYKVCHLNLMFEFGVSALSFKSLLICLGIKLKTVAIFNVLPFTARLYSFLHQPPPSQVPVEVFKMVPPSPQKSIGK